MTDLVFFYKNLHVLINWRTVHNRSLTNKAELYDLILLYNSTTDQDSYQKALDKLGIEFSGYNDLEVERNELAAQIEEVFMSDYFFKGVFIKEILNKKILNLNQYKDLSFRDAEQKYDEKRIFQERKPLISYQNGFKWIDTGKSCPVVGKHMSNCGSVGVMSNDPDRTLISLFDAENKPHVIVTYSPNQKRISGDQGQASTAVKPEYHHYVIDLADKLNAEFDVNSSKSTLLGIKYLLRKATDAKQISNDIYNQRFQFNYQGKIYYTDGKSVLSQEELNKVPELLKNISAYGKPLGNLFAKSQPDLITKAFQWGIEDQLRQKGINYLNIKQFQS